MNGWSALWAELREDGTPYVAAGLAITLVLLRVARCDEKRRVRGMSLFAVLHVVLALTAAALRSGDTVVYRDLRLAATALGAVAGVSMSGAVLFAVFLPRVRLTTPRILQDVLVAGAAIATVFIAASRSGFNVSSLVATSAVLTAVIGFSLQDTLGNIAGGLSLQLDNSISVGDWIKLGDVTGRVTEIRWRYTAVETRNWETALIPNSVLVKNQVTVLGRRGDQPLQLRRWVWFQVDYRYAPSEVIRAVTEALRSAEIPNVAEEPPPNCVLMEFAESYGNYAVRYWLTDLMMDDPTDSRVRTWIYFALKRAAIPLALPARAQFVTQESADRKLYKQQEDLAQRVRAICSVELFAHVSDEERERLAQALRPAPFAAGEVMTRQGAEAHWLYIVSHGTASVRLGSEGAEREVAQLHDGDFFGEMSLMTGERRSATVVAVTDVDCYRLDKSAFQQVVRARPELADLVAGILARRRSELVAVKEGLDQAAAARRCAADKRDLLGRIRGFFGLGDERAAG